MQCQSPGGNISFSESVLLATWSAPHFVLRRARLVIWRVRSRCASTRREPSRRAHDAVRVTGGMDPPLRKKSAGRETACNMLFILSFSHELCNTSLSPGILSVLHLFLQSTLASSSLLFNRSQTPSQSPFFSIAHHHNASSSASTKYNMLVTYTQTGPRSSNYPCSTRAYTSTTVFKDDAGHVLKSLIVMAFH